MNDLPESMDEAEAGPSAALDQEPASTPGPAAASAELPPITAIQHAPPTATSHHAPRRPARPSWPVRLLLIGLIAGAWLRFSGMDWDANQHLHPDERFLTMVSEKLELPQDFLGYLDTDTSTLNPRNVGHEFYVYGTWPITVAYLVGRATESTDYFSIYMVGRQLSALYSLLALLFVYGIGTRLFDRRVGGLAALLCSVTAFTIQQAHFYTVDTPAMFYFAAFLFFAISVVGRRGWAGWRETLPAGLAMGMGLASKVSLWPMVPVFVAALGVEVWQRGRKRGDWISAALKTLVVGAAAFAALRLCQPDMFAGPGWQNVVANPDRFAQVTGAAPSWWRAIDERLPDALKPLLLPDPRWAANMHTISGQVQGYGMDWPPNHQWWGRRDWLFPLRNIVRYGMGWPLGLVSWAGLAWAAWRLIKGRRTELTLPVLFSGLYFFINGAQWSKTMRYFLPLYPVLTVLGAALLIHLWDRAAAQPATAPRDGSRTGGRLGRAAAAALVAAVVAGTALWGFMFSRIYSRDHSRVAASKWIYHHVPTAIGLTVDEAAGDAAGPLIPVPVQFPDLVFSPTSFDFTIPVGGWLGPVRVQIPPPGPPTVTGLQISHLRVTGAATAQVEAALSLAPDLDQRGAPKDVVATGKAAARPGADAEQTLRVAWAPVQLTSAVDPEPAPRGLERLFRAPAAAPPEGTPTYYVWLRVTGSPILARPTVFVNQTNWDDFVPHSMYGWAAFDNPGGTAEGFVGLLEVNLYDEDRDPAKLERVLGALSQADYTLATSNRVYGSTRQIPVRYPWTNRLYEALFGEEFGFEHTASIHSFPNLGPWEVDDQPAEEAFHVYDHPQVDVWKVAGADFEALRAELEPLVAEACWKWPTDKRSLLDRLVLSWVREPEASGLRSRCD